MDDSPGFLPPTAEQTIGYLESEVERLRAETREEVQWRGEAEAQARGLREQRDALAGALIASAPWLAAILGPIDRRRFDGPTDDPRGVMRTVVAALKLAGRMP
jgi:hypothetical protein